MVSRRDYSDAVVESARSVMLEVSRILGEYQENIVVVGGWVPELLLTQASVRHVGSIDVDLALDHRRFSESGYQTILTLLLSHGYRPGKQPYIFHRTVIHGDREIIIEAISLPATMQAPEKNIEHREYKTYDLAKREELISHSKIPS